MAQEYETQVLDIDEREIEKKLRELGAKEEPEILQRRWVFGMQDGEWIRLREVGDKVAICYKNRQGQDISGTEEIETEVQDFEKTAEILGKIDFKEKYYQENKRRMFLLDDMEISIDTWPQIPTYLEIDAKSEEKVKEGLKVLGLEGKDVGHLGTKHIYDKYGIDLHSIKELTF